MCSWHPEGPLVGETPEAEVIGAFVDPEAEAEVEVWVDNGDDAAVFEPTPGHGVVVTTDDFVEDVHFTRALIEPGPLGARLVAVNVSDVAAMGGRPVHLFLSVALPRGLSMAAARAMGAGLRRRCQAEGLRVLGGNVARSPGPIFLSATVTGEIEPGRALRRKGAQVGDDVWMSGPPGRAAAGLALALKLGPPAVDDPRRSLYEAWAAPPSRVAFARRCAAEGWVHAMCDVSDGVGTDLPRLLQACGAELDLDAFRVDPQVEAVAREAGEDRFGFAFSGGEDYELLFMSAPENRAALEGAAYEMNVPLLRLGVVQAEPGVRLRSGDRVRPLGRGHDHFGRRDP